MPKLVKQKCNWAVTLLSWSTWTLPTHLLSRSCDRHNRTSITTYLHVDVCTVHLTVRHLLYAIDSSENTITTYLNHQNTNLGGSKEVQWTIDETAWPALYAHQGSLFVWATQIRKKKKRRLQSPINFMFTSSRQNNFNRFFLNQTLRESSIKTEAAAVQTLKQGKSEHHFAALFNSLSYQNRK